MDLDWVDKKGREEFSAGHREVLPTTLSSLHLVAKGRYMHLPSPSESCNKPIVVQTLPPHTGTGQSLGHPLACLLSSSMTVFT